MQLGNGPRESVLYLKIDPFTLFTLSRFRCMFWNAEYNALASLPTLLDVFLRDTQKVRACPYNYRRASIGLPLSLFYSLYLLRSWL
jgi:hypothetical protein